MAQQTINLENSVLVLVNMGALALLFGALSLMLSGFGLGRGAAIGVAGGLAAITYLLHGLAPVADLPEIVQKTRPGTTIMGARRWLRDRIGSTC